MNNNLDKSKYIFGNKISDRDYKKAVKAKKKFIKKFGDDSTVSYNTIVTETPVIGQLFGVENIKVTMEAGKKPAFDEKAVMIGNIRMGFGHYRISMAMASCARAMGYKPYWFDLCSQPETTCGKIIAYQNDLYSMGSRMSQKIGLFNKLVWEPMNSEGFRKLTYNCSDQKVSELMSPVFKDIPKDIPYVATHVWPAQAAVHAGLTHVVNAIPDNWPMALHLAEGSIHTVQTPSAWLGYKALRGMDKKRELIPIPDDSVKYTGHYVGHELVSNIKKDCEMRYNRINSRCARRYLATVGGAGAGTNIYEAIIKDMLPDIIEKKAVLFLNVGDHKNVWEQLLNDIPQMKKYVTEHFDNYTEIEQFVEDIYKRDTTGIHVFYHEDIFAAVYSTNALMRVSDVLITKPSELSFYPIPKLMIKRVGGHEAWGAIRAAEVGDGTYECDTLNDINSMIKLIQNDDIVLKSMIDSILKADESGTYNGAYEVINLAVNGIQTSDK